ncbi:MAG: damage-control phosphatase ARMT1 family protein [Desulfovibrionales bacterium]
MKTTLACIPCLIRQALDVIKLVTPDETEQEQFMRIVLQEVSSFDLSLTPPHVAQHLHRVLRRQTGIDDPFFEAKKRFNAMALDMLPGMEHQVRHAEDPLAMAVRMAIAGNIIDLGVNHGLTEIEARKAIDRVLTEPFHGELEVFKRAAAKAESILYLADNAGEIVFDRLLIEQLSPVPVTVAVRGNPIINDATMEDARQAGIHDLAEVIDNGADAPGTLLDECPDSFLEHFRKADLIVAKGQGNYETLNTASGPIFFLFKVKCPVVAAKAGLEVGTQALIQA